MNRKLLCICGIAFAIGVISEVFFHVPKNLLFVGSFIGGLSGLAAAAQRSGTNSVFIYIAVFLIAFSLGAMRAEFVPSSLPSRFVPSIKKYVSYTGTVIADPDVREKNQQVTIHLRDKNQYTNVLAFAPLSGHYEYGERVVVTGIFSIPAPFATTPGRVFRYDHYLAKKGIFATIPRARIDPIRAPMGIQNYLANILFYVKHLFVYGLYTALPSTYAALATGLLTGNQHQLDEGVETLLTLSGLVWVVVLSGYHVMMIAEGTLWATSHMKFPERMRLVFAGMCILAVIFATGASAPSLRGGIMACITLFARATGRKYDSLRALCFTLIVITLWNPLLLTYDIGFQLSLIVTPALILATPILESQLLWIPYSFVREVLAVSIVAQLACVPLLLWENGELALWAIPANIFVMSFVPISMALSFIAGMGGIVFPHIATLIGFPAELVLYYLLTVGKIAASLPYAGTIVPAFSFTYVPVMYTLLAVGVWKLQRKTPARMRESF